MTTVQCPGDMAGKFFVWHQGAGFVREVAWGVVKAVWDFESNPVFCLQILKAVADGSARGTVYVVDTAQGALRVRYAGDLKGYLFFDTEEEARKHFEYLTKE